MKLSQAFASFRTQIVNELQAEISAELIPSFNAEIVDIRSVWEKERQTSEALADHKKRARIADLVVRRNQYLDAQNLEMRESLENRVKEYKGVINEITLKDEKTNKDKIILEAKFPDQSTARFPKALWINYKAFERV